MKINKKRNILKLKMRKSIILSIVITALIFCCIIFYLAFDILKLASNYVSNSIGLKIAIEMNSEDFLRKHNINSLEEFGPSSPGYQEWAANVSSLVNVNPIAPSDERYKNKFPRFAMNYNVRMLNAFSQVKVTINGNVIYSNIPNDSSLSSNYILNKVYSLYDLTSTNKLADRDFRYVGTIDSRINPRLITIVYLTFTLLIIIASVLAFIFAVLFSKFAVYPIINPIEQLEKKIKSIAQEDFETTANTQIVLKKPPLEVASIADAANTIMQKLQGYNEQIVSQNQILESQNSELESQNMELIESRQKIEETQQKLYEREKSVRTLLDNAGQGVLSFGRDLFVDSEYSSECLKIFDTYIENKYLPDILFPSDEDQKNFFIKVILKIFDETSLHKKSIYLPLLPEDIVINNKTIHIDYKLIDDIDNDSDNDIMLILTDITHNKQLEGQIEQERNVLKMVVKAVVNRSDFINNINDYFNFCSTGIDEIFSMNKDIDEITYSVFREIHTFKGNFSQLCLISIVEKLHDIESGISEFRKNIASYNITNLRNFIDSCRLDTLLDEDIKSLKLILGSDYLKKDEIVIVDSQKLIDLEKEMLKTLSPFECKTLIPCIRELRYQEFRDSFTSYSDYIQRIASNLGKLVEPLEISGGRFKVDNSKYRDFIKSLVHVFRNIMDHAIETPEERIEAGKAETGKVTCSIYLNPNNTIRLIIKDDGRGIDINTLKETAVKKNFYNKDEVSQMSDDQILQLIFRNGFSTKDEVTSLSGRGLGLSAVKAEIEKLSGSVKVKTKYGYGTEFQFTLPYEPLNDFSKITISSILKPIVLKAKNIINDTSPETSPDTFLIAETDRLQMLNYTVFIGIKGIISGKILISVDETLARIITKKFIFDTVTFEEETELIQDALAECTNVIIGNSFKLIPELEDLVVMDTPVTINSDNATFSCHASRIWSVDIALDNGKMKLGFTSVDDIDE